MASERTINEYDSTRIANAVDTLAENLSGYTGSTVTPTTAMKGKLPSQTVGDRIADAVEDMASSLVVPVANGGTGATTVAGALENLGVDMFAVVDGKLCIVYESEG